MRTGLELSSVCMCLPRAFEDESKARLGVVECAKHELLQPFNVMQERDGECDPVGDCLFCIRVASSQKWWFQS